MAGKHCEQEPVAAVRLIVQVDGGLCESFDALRAPM
jgi:hypothetical protein